MVSYHPNVFQHSFDLLFEALKVGGDFWRDLSTVAEFLHRLWLQITSPAQHGSTDIQDIMAS